VGEGTGLGLDISWRIVANKHHGAIQVESVPGSTRFRVWLPLAASEPDATQEPGTAPETGREPEPGDAPEPHEEEAG
jgi:hypothetical protein